MTEHDTGKCISEIEGGLMQLQKELPYLEKTLSPEQMKMARLHTDFMVISLQGLNTLLKDSTRGNHHPTLNLVLTQDQTTLQEIVQRTYFSQEINSTENTPLTESVDLVQKEFNF